VELNPYEPPLATADPCPTRREREDRHNLIYLVPVVALLLLLAVLCAFPAVFATLD